MNKFTSSIRLFALISVLSGGLVHASSLTEEQTHYLDYIESKIQAYVVFSTHWAQNFLNPKNNDSYAKCVNAYRDAFVSFEHDVLGSLKTEKRVAGAAGASDYGQAITLIHDIVSKVYDPAKHVYTILEKHRRNTNPTMVGIDLGAVDKYTKPEFISGVQSQLRRLQTIFNRIYQSLAKKIDIIIESLEQRKAKKLNPIESWKALKHRVSCK